jgi:hypothetical protein
VYSRNAAANEKGITMQRFFIELKKNLNSLEKPITFYIQAYNRDQIVDMFGDEYFIITIDQCE